MATNNDAKKRRSKYEGVLSSHVVFDDEGNILSVEPNEKLTKSEIESGYYEHICKKDFLVEWIKNHTIKIEYDECGRDEFLKKFFAEANQDWSKKFYETKAEVEAQVAKLPKEKPKPLVRIKLQVDLPSIENQEAYPKTFYGRIAKFIDGLGYPAIHKDFFYLIFHRIKELGFRVSDFDMTDTEHTMHTKVLYF